jgi:RND family efflux transporter MFP subunit
MRSALVLLAVLGLAAAVIVFARTRSARERSGAEGTLAAATQEAAAVPVAAVAVRRADLEDTLTLSAEFRPFQEVNVYAKVAGYVRQMRVDVGSRVKAGDLLAVLEIPELQDDLQHASAAVERSRGEVARAKAAYDDAHLTYARLAQVVKEQPNLIAQQEIDQARAQDEAMKAAWEAAQASVAEARATRAKYRTLIRYSRIAAPFDGVITRRLADTGALVGAGTSSNGQALVRLAQLDPLRLVLPVPESAVPRLTPGAPVTVLVQATGERMTGKIARASGEVALDTRTMHVEVDVPNPALTLAPGMFAAAVLSRERRDGVLVLPIEAVPARKGDSASVLAVDKDRRLQERKLVLGLETPGAVEVRSGLSEGDLVVVGGRGYQPGQRVEPRVAGDKGNVP